MDRGAWWATVHGVSMSQKQLKHSTAQHNNGDTKGRNRAEELGCYLQIGRKPEVFFPI